MASKFKGVAKASLAQVARLGKENDQLLQAVSLHQQGRLDDAKVVYQALLKKNSRHFDALHLLGVIAKQSQNFLLAVDLFAQAIKVNPNNAEVHSNLGVALMDLQQFEDALACFERALSLKPGYVEAHMI